MPTIEKAIEEQCYGRDLVLGVPIRWGLGFGLTSKEMPVGPNPRTFYWGGWGGSAVVMDLDAKLCFAYVMNKMTTGTLGDSRVAGPAMALISAL
jgi:CubicO group peptidase (beta-lactamase class C family)